MKLVVMAVGKPKKSFCIEGIDHYLRLVRPYISLELIFLKSHSPRLGGNFVDIIRAEGEQIRKSLKSEDYVITLTEKGELFSSESFSDRLQKTLLKSRGRMVFVIGGPFGLEQDIIDGSQCRLSLSPMTFPHDLCMVLLIEQLYRGFKILKKETYHY